MRANLKRLASGGGPLNLRVFGTNIFSAILSPEALDSRDFANLTPKFSFNFGTSDAASVSRYIGKHTGLLFIVTLYLYERGVRLF